jgi:hypothetical protein
MAIYNLFEEVVPEHNQVSHDTEPKGDRFFSSIAARFFFLLLLIGDLFWLAYTLVRVVILLPLLMITCGRCVSLARGAGKVFLSLKRGLVSLLALFVSLFSPALGIMFACTYFLMYDRAGIDEVVPASLRPQFHSFMNPAE